MATTKNTPEQIAKEITVITATADKKQKRVLQDVAKEHYERMYQQHEIDFNEKMKNLTKKEYNKYVRTIMAMDVYHVRRQHLFKMMVGNSITHGDYHLRPPIAIHRRTRLSTPSGDREIFFDGIQYYYDDRDLIRPQMLSSLIDMEPVSDSIDRFADVIHKKEISIDKDTSSVLTQLIETIKGKTLELGPETQNLLKSIRSIFNPLHTSKVDASALREYLDKSEDENLKTLVEQLIIDSEVQDGCMIDAASVCIFVFSSLYQYINGGTVSFSLMVLSGGMLMRTFSGKVMDIIISYFNKSKINDVSPQMNEGDIEDFVTGLLALVAAIVCYNSPKKVTAATLFAGLGNFDRVKRGTVSLATLVFEILERVINYFKEGSTAEYRILKSQVPEIERFCADSDLILDCEARGEFYRDEVHLQELRTIINNGKKIYSSITKNSRIESSMRLLDRQLRKLDTLLQVFIQKMVDGNGMKQEPVGILLQGAPGVGKSIIMEHLNNAILSSILPEDKFKSFLVNPDTFVFNRQAEVKYWEGYKQHSVITMFDDFGQGLDIPGSLDNEFMNILRIVNTFRTDLHTAAIETKGTLSFNSKFVVCSTNRKKIECNSLFSTWALNRRFHIRVVVIPHPDCAVDKNSDYYSQRLDHSKMPHIDFNGKNMTSLDPSVQMYVNTDEEGNPYGDPFDFDTLVTRVLEKYHLHANRHQLAKSQFHDTAMRYRDKYKPVVVPQISSTNLVLNKILSSFTTRQLERAQNALPYFESVGANVCDLWDQVPTWFVDVKPDEFTLITLTLLIRRDGFFSEEFGDEYLLSKLRTLKESDFVIQDGIGERIIKSFNAACMKVIEVTTPPIVVAFAVIYKYKHIITAILGVFFLDKVRKYFTQPVTVVTYGQSFGLSDKLRTSRPASFKDMARAKPQVSSSMDRNGWSVISKISKKNTFCVRWVRQSGRVNKLGYLLMIKDRIGLLPFHFIVTLSEHCRSDPSLFDDVILFTKPGRHDNFRYKCTIRDLLDCRFGDEDLFLRDLCLVDLREFGVQPCVDILKYIISETNLHKLDGQFPSALILPDKEISSIGGMAKPLDRDICVSSPAIGDYEIRYGFSYTSSTEDGDCGGFLAYLNPALPADKIVGIHVAGQTSVGMGFAASFSRELLSRYIDTIPDLISSDEIDVDFVIDDRIVSQGQFEYVGEVKHFPARCQNSELVRSPLHNSYTKSPNGYALLRTVQKGDVIIDPFENAFKKYCLSGGVISVPRLEACVDSFEDYMYSHSSVYSTKKVFTTLEALTGLEEDVLFHGIPSGTSAGYPMNTRACENIKKKFYYGTEAESALALQEIELHVNDTIACAKTGNRKVWIYTDSLKDEKRPIEKVKVGNTRMFSGIPFIYLVVFRRYFGAFSLWILKNKNSNSFVSGVNPFSSEWDSIARQLSSCADGKVGAGDYKGFDGSLSATGLYAILGIINRWYDDGNDHIREVLWMEVVNSRHIKDGTIYEWCGGLPSGHFYTLVINCIYNNLAFRYCWISLGLSIFEFNKNVVLKVCGDDNIFAVTGKYQETFNEMTIVEPMASIGLTYTTEFKDKAVLPFRDITEVEFLKRNFRYENLLGRYVAPLRLSVVLDIPMWSKKGSDYEKIAVSNAIEALRELSLHSDSVYLEWEPRIRREFLKKYIGVSTPHPLIASRIERLVDITSDSRFIQ